MVFPKTITKTIRNKNDYVAFLADWKANYRSLSKMMKVVKAHQRLHQNDPSQWQHDLEVLKERARALNSLRQANKHVAQNLFLKGREKRHAQFTKVIEAAATNEPKNTACLSHGMENHFQQYPLVMGCKVVDFFFNKGHLSHPTIIPRWVVKAKGKSFYVHHVDCQVGWNTRELDSGSTLGTIRLKNCVVSISEDGVCTITER